MSRVAKASSYADADLEHDGGADHRKPPGGGATNGSTHGSQTVVTGTPIPTPRDRRADSHRNRAPGSCAHRNCKVNLDDLRWDCPHLDCEPKQARGNPRKVASSRVVYESDLVVRAGVS